MTSPPDKIFRDGLGQYQKKAPPAAWNRIESNLDRKRNLSPWMKIAAGLMLVVATSILLWQQNQSAGSEQLAVSSEGSEQLAVISEQLAATNRESSVTNRESSVVSREETVEVDLSRRSKPKQVDATVKSSLQSENTHATNQLAVIREPDEIITEPSATAQVEITNEKVAREVASEYKRTNITYTADEVNSKFLKKEMATEATPEKKNTSGIQKVITVALNLYEEPLVGELREKKNEWLSINTSPKKRDINK